ncbi:MAG TPA: fibronectin type III domain-containing protein, partial [Elusimicrobiales bacterium]|nr:fibronectin type III domain-containing protein [Elusimicrobiales bacterium]
YQAQISTSADFLALTASTQTINTFALFDNLEPDTTYYVRVAAVNDAGVPGQFLNIGEVATGVAPPAAAAQSFVSVSTNSFTIQWASGDNPPDTLYRAAISTSSDFSAEYSTKTISTSISFIDLGANTPYYARVAAVGRNGQESDYLVLGSTVTHPAVPALAAQTFMDVYSSSFTTHWSANNNGAGTNYKVQISTAADFATIAQSYTTQDTQYQATGLASNATYYVEVAAIGLDGTYSPFSYFGFVKTAPAVPGAPFATSVQDNSLAVGWTDGGNGVGTQYELQIATGQDFAEATVRRIENLAATVDSLVHNTTYFMRVGVVGDDNSVQSFSPTATAITLATKPTAAADPLPAVYANFITGAWQPVPGAAGYLLEASTSNFNGGVIYSSATQDAALASLTVSGLAMTTNYYLRVGALNWGGAANYTALGSALTSRFAMPTVVSPTYTDISESSITVHWGDNGNSAQTVYALDVARSPWFSSYNTFETGATSLMVYDLLPNTSYYFRVQSKIPGTSSAYAALGEAVTLGAKPANPVPVLDITGITVNWSVLADTSASQGFALQASTDNFGGAAIYSASTANTAATSLAIPGLLTNTVYYVRLGSLNSAGTMNYTQFGQLTTLPGGPPGFPELYRVYASSAVVRWTPVHSAGYEVAASSTNFDGSGDALSIATADGEASTLTITNLVPNTPYVLKVGAIFNGVPTYAVLGSTLTLVNIPAQFEAVASTQSMSVSWGANGNASNTVYELSYSKRDNFITEDYISRVPQLMTTGYTLLGLEPNSLYYLRLRAVDSAQRATPYAAISLPTLETPPPPAPVLLSATPQKAGAIRLAWEAQAGFGVSSYAVYRSPNDIQSIAGLTPLVANYNSSAYTDTPPADGFYYYAVVAHDSYGKDSQPSASLSATSDRTAVSAVLALSTVPASGVLGPGSYTVTAEFTEPLADLPFLTFKALNQSPALIALEPITPTLWVGTATVTASMPSGAASFAFEGQDMAGNVGTAITAGASWTLDTQGPSATMAFSGPVRPALTYGNYPFSLSLNEPVSAVLLQYNSPTSVQHTVSLSSASGNAALWQGTLEISSGTEQGNFTFQYSATDLVGNNATLLSGTTYFMVDTVPCAQPQFLHAGLLSAGRVRLSWSA